MRGGDVLRALPEPPDEDWLHQFLDTCKDIGDDRMQTVWGKLLAGEVASLGTYSLLTLNTVRTLRKREADLFTKFCTFVWRLDGELFPI